MNADPLRPPDTDDEPWSYTDDLAPARGCLVGIVGGLLLWALLIAAAVIVWSAGLERQQARRLTLQCSSDPQDPLRIHRT